MAMCNNCRSFFFQVGQLSRLQRLSISSSRISDAGLWHLRGLTSLRQLFLHNTQISDEALINLAVRLLVEAPPQALREAHLTTDKLM